MTRTLLAIAAAALAAAPLFASTAHACISCEYVPEVAKSASPSRDRPSTSYGVKVHKKERSYQAYEARKSRAAKSRVVKSQPAAQPVEKTVKAATAAPPAVAASDAENENSAITTQMGTAPPVARKVDTAVVAPPVTKSVNEHSTITTAGLQRTETAGAEQTASDPNEEPNKVSTNLGCKKFFPTVGLTLSVPCE